MTKNSHEPFTGRKTVLIAAPIWFVDRPRWQARELVSAVGAVARTLLVSDGNRPALLFNEVHRRVELQWHAF